MSLQEAVRKNTCVLLDNIDPKNIIDRLFQDGALSDEECEEILGAPTRKQRAWRLLYHLRHRDPQRQPFAVFVESLRKDHDFLVELLEETMWKLRETTEPKERRASPQAGLTICPNCRWVMQRQAEGVGNAPVQPATRLQASQVVDCVSLTDDLPAFCSAKGNLCEAGDAEEAVHDMTLDALHKELKTQLLNDPDLVDGVTPPGISEDSSSAEGYQPSSADELLFPTTEGASSSLNRLHELSREFNCSCSVSSSSDAHTPDQIEDDDDNSVFAWHFGQYFQQRLSRLTCSSETSSSGYRGGSSSFSSTASLESFDQEQRLLIQERLSGFTLMPPANGGRRYGSHRLKLLFDKLSSIINSGGFGTFKQHQTKLLEMRPKDADLVCMLFYLEACTYLFRGQLDECERVIDRALRLVPFTSNPSKIMVEVFSLRCWMYLKENRLNALEHTIQDAAQLITQDPLGCAGKAAGWIYVDEARRLVPLMSSGNLCRSYKIRAQAIKNLEKALEQFQQEDGKDGPFGYHFASIKLAMLLLACGELMQTTDLQPTEKEIVEATRRLREVEASSIGHPAILKAQYYMAMADLHYRRLNLARAMNYAQEALHITKKLGMPEEIRCARARRDFHRNLQEQALIFGTCSSGGGGQIKQRHDSGRYGVPDGRCKYLTSSNNEESDIPYALEVRPPSPGVSSRKEDSDLLRLFVRLWLLVVLLSSCWVHAEGGL